MYSSNTSYSEVLDADDAPFWILDSTKHQEYRSNFFIKHDINPNKKTIFIHPGSGGSSKTLSLDQFIELCEGLRSFDDYNFVRISVIRGIFFSLLIYYSFLISNF